MMAKPMKTLELHFSVIQFLLIIDSSVFLSSVGSAAYNLPVTCKQRFGF